MEGKRHSAIAPQLHLTTWIRSESPGFDPASPEVALRKDEANEADDGRVVDAADDTGRVEELQARTTSESENSNEAPSRLPA
jgi:hypothetical protein